MSVNSMSLKAKINNYAKQHKIAPQVVLQNYLFEHFLERIAASDFREHLIIKGGLLISSIVGLDTRSTMDLDTTLRQIRLTSENVERIVKKICAIDIGDDIKFELKSIEEERKNDRYGGFCVKMSATYGSITAAMSIDMTTGDIITPTPVEYDYGKMFETDQSIKLLAYNLETILAEKMETILSRNILNTRIRDFYDIYILSTTKKIDFQIFSEALKATAQHRGSWENINDSASIINTLSINANLKTLWTQYCKKFPYAKGIEFEAIIEQIRRVCVNM